LLGPIRAADLQKRLAEKTFSTAKCFALSNRIDLEVCFEGSNEKKMKKWLGSFPAYSRQIPGDIGIRMHHTILNAFRSGSRPVVLIGTDIPHITEMILKRTYENLTQKDLVLGPSTDGGYWLIGMNEPTNLFKDIEWSTDRVLKQTLQLAKKQNLTYRLLDTLTDIDTEKSLMKIMPEEANRKPYVSVIIPTLNESENINTAVHSARHPDSEIIMVDGGSMDDTVKKAKAAGIKVITGPRGRSRQQNVGAKRALGNVILFLHADTILPENYISHVFNTFMDNHVVAGAFKFKTDYSQFFMTLVELGAHIRSKHFQLPYGDQALFLRKRLFDLLGGFPEVAIAEDLFFAQKLSITGKIHIVPEPAITSCRRWKMRGPVRTWLINTMILAGCKLGISPRTLASLYKMPKSKQ
jgi:rSAM/selenodomain-associated transferase 2/rSAM/selenodomain-associated transferase 1